MGPILPTPWWTLKTMIDFRDALRLHGGLEVTF